MCYLVSEFNKDLEFSTLPWYSTSLGPEMKDMSRGQSQLGHKSPNPIKYQVN